MTTSLPQFRMLHRPYALARPAWDSRAFYWLTRSDGAGVDRVIDRGEGHSARLRIERFLVQAARAGAGDEWRMAVRALRQGWERRP